MPRSVCPVVIALLVSAAALPARAAASDHFLCYQAGVTAGGPGFQRVRGLRLVDQFQDRDADVRKSVGLCVPAEADGSGVDHPDLYLAGYAIKNARTGPGGRPTGTAVKIANRFGEVVLDVRAPDRLLVPAGADPARPVDPPDPATLTLDHYACYAVRAREFAPVRGVPVVDRFNQAKRYDLESPSRLCVPADKEGEGIKDPTAHLLCYRARRARGEPALEAVPGIHTNDQLGPGQVDTVREEELCVPSDNPRVEITPVQLSGLGAPPLDVTTDPEVLDELASRFAGLPRTSPPATADDAMGGFLIANTSDERLPPRARVHAGVVELLGFVDDAGERLFYRDDGGLEAFLASLFPPAPAPAPSRAPAPAPHAEAAAPAGGDVVRPGEVFTTDFRTTPPFDFEPGILLVTFSFVFTRATTARTFSIFDGDRLLGQVTDTSFGTFTGRLDGHVSFRAADSLDIYPPSSIVDFAAIRSGGIQGRIDVTTATGEMRIDDLSLHLTTGGGGTVTPAPVVKFAGVPPLPRSGSERPYEPARWNGPRQVAQLDRAALREANPVIYHALRARLDQIRRTDPRGFFAGIQMARNNCGNYACDVRQLAGFAYPGRGGGRPLDPNFSVQDGKGDLVDANGNGILDELCARLVDAYRADRMTDVDGDGGVDERDCDARCPAGSYKVALVVGQVKAIASGSDKDRDKRPDTAWYDYHWYRQDDTGRWSHKPGSSTVRDRDAAGDLILDPRLASHDYPQVNYSRMCGCMCIDPRTVLCRSR